MPGAVAAQADATDGWSWKSELTSVLSAGNSEALTFGLGAVVENRRARNVLRFEAGAVRTESTRITRRAVGTAANYEIVRDENREKTAEAYFARARYDRSLSEHFFLFGGLDWLRNTFAGIDSRFLMALGAGNTWIEGETARFKTNYAITYTFQSDVVENPFVKSSFPGLRTGWEYWRRATASTEFESVLISDLNLDESDDVRIDFTNSLNVAISSALALKPSLQLLWRNLPALTDVELETTGGTPLGESVQVPLRKLDSFFRLALVVKL
jgi:putative salt-induced outer membrane protein YdiY